MNIEGMVCVDNYAQVLLFEHMLQLDLRQSVCRHDIDPSSDHFRGNHRSGLKLHHIKILSETLKIIP